MIQILTTHLPSPWFQHTSLAVDILIRPLTLTLTRMYIFQGKKNYTQLNLLEFFECSFVNSCEYSLGRL